MASDSEYLIDVYYKDVESMLLRAKTDAAAIGEILAQYSVPGLDLVLENQKSMVIMLQSWMAQRYGKAGVTPDYSTVPRDLWPRAMLAQRAKELGYPDEQVKGRNVKDLRALITASEGSPEEEEEEPTPPPQVAPKAFKLPRLIKR